MKRMIPPKEALALLNEGLTCAQIAERLGCNVQEAHDLVCEAWRQDKASKGGRA